MLIIFPILELWEGKFLPILVILFEAGLSKGLANGLGLLGLFTIFYASPF